MPALSTMQLRRIGLAACLVTGGFLIAHSINAFVAEALYVPPDGLFVPTGHETAAPPSSPSQSADAIRASGLFLVPLTSTSGSQGGMTPGGVTAHGTAVRASIGASAKIRLIGVVFGEQRGVFAIVEELGNKKQALYRLHEQIPDIGEVSEIRRDSMVVRLGDQEELLELALNDRPVAAVAAPGASPAPGAPLRKVIDRREVEQAMNDLPRLLTQARAVPNMVNGTLNGFRIDYIAKASFYEKIGIQSGDVLQRVNGVDIRDPSTMLSLLQQLKNERMVKLDLVRNNQRSTVTYELR